MRGLFAWALEVLRETGLRRDSLVRSKRPTRAIGFNVVVGPKSEAIREAGADPIAARQAARKAAGPIPTFGEIAALVVADAQTRTGNQKVNTSGSATSARPIQVRCSTGR
jgi:hypothetical protein